MNINKSSIWMLALVFGVGTVFYVLDALPSQKQKSAIKTSIVTPSSIQTLVPIVPSITTPSITIQPTLIATATPIVTITKKDYSASVNYQVRRFQESISIVVTLDNKKVTALKVSHVPSDGESGMYHDGFDSEIQPLVVGKNISDINVSRVAGASDTSNAFMQAIEKIRANI